MITIPTLAELYSDIKSDIESELSITIPIFGKSVIRALASVQAAKLKLYYYGIAKLQKNIFVDTAEPETIGGTLGRFGRVKLNRGPRAATAAQYTVTITGTIGATIPAQTTFKSDDTAANAGKLFILDTAYVMTAASDSITLRALEGGLDSQLSVSDTLTATAPITNVDRTATVTVESTSPVSAETTEQYRTNILQAFRLEPQGGAASDYRLWSLDAAGVRTVYPFARSGYANEVDVYVEANADDSTDGKGTPSTTILEAVEDVIELDPDTTKPLSERGRRPLGVFAVNVQSISVQVVDITIASSPFTAAEQTSIESALEAALLNIRPFVSGADVLEDRNDILDSNRIINVILNTVPGSSFGAITLEVDSVATSSYQFLLGEIPNLNTLTFS